MPANNSVLFNNKNIPTPPPLRFFTPSEKQTEKQQLGLTEQQFQQNMAELKGILSQVDSLMSNGKNSPETVAHCQALMGYATAINLPQSQKNQLIGQFPPKVQQMYKQVAKSSEAKTAQRGVMQQAMEIAMAQKHSDIFAALQGQPPEVWNSRLLNSSINDFESLNVAIQNGWDINAKHKNPDGTESTYVEYQGTQIDKGIEGSNKANATIKDLIGKSPRSKEEEEEYRKAQQVAENNHKNIMGSAQNVVNAIKSGKLNEEEMAKAQAELRKIEEYEKEQRQLAQYFRDLAAKETDPHKRAEYEAQAGVHESRANEAHLLTEGVKQNRLQRDKTKNTFKEEGNATDKPRNRVHTGSKVDGEQIDQVKAQHTDDAKEKSVAQQDLTNLAMSTKPIEEESRMSEEVQGRQNSNPQTPLAVLDEHQSGFQNTRLAENSKNQNNIDETRATKIESSLTNSEYDVNPIISRNVSPEKSDNLDKKYQDFIMIDRFERPSTRQHKNTHISIKDSETLSNPSNDLETSSRNHRDLSSNQQQTGVNDDFMSMINTVSTPQQNTSMDNTKSNSSPSAPTLPHIAQATQLSQTSSQSNITPANLDKTVTPTQSTPKTSSGLSNTIRSVANASIVPDDLVINTENNTKPLDTSRNV